MKSTIVIALAVNAVAQFVDPYDRLARERLINTRLGGEIPINRFIGGGPAPMTVGADALAYEDNAPGLAPFYNNFPLYPRPSPAAPYLLPAANQAFYPATLLPARPTAFEPNYSAGLTDAQKRAKLDLINQEGNIDQFANQANALDALYRTRASGGSLATRDSLTPTAITSERMVVGPKSAADQAYKQANGGTYRNQGNLINRANKAATTTFEPLYA